MGVGSSDITLTFDSDAEGLAEEGLGAHIAFAWYASDGSPSSGCVRFTNSATITAETEGAAHSPDIAWTDLGVPAGASVKTVRAWCQTKLASAPASYSRELAINIASSGSHVTADDLILLESDVADPLGSWATQEGVSRAVTGTYSPASTAIGVQVRLTLTTGSADAFEYRIDSIRLLIGYQTPSAGGASHTLQGAFLIGVPLGLGYCTHHSHELSGVTCADCAEMWVTEGNLGRRRMCPSGQASLSGAIEPRSGEASTVDVIFSWERDGETWNDVVVAQGAPGYVATCYHNGSYLVAYCVNTAVKLKRTADPSNWPGSPETPSLVGRPIAMCSCEDGSLVLDLESSQHISRDGGVTWTQISAMSHTLGQSQLMACGRSATLVRLPQEDQRGVLLDLQNWSW